MQVSVEITSGLERRLTIGVPAQEVDAEVDSRLQKAAKNLRVKGFRPGKVPMKIVRQRYGAGVRQEVLGDVMSRSFYDAVNQEALRPAGQPRIEAKSVDEGKDLEFTATFEIYPEVQLTDFSNLAIRRPVAEVTDADVEKMVEVLRSQQATWESVDREAADGDRLTIDFVGRRDGEPFDGGSAEDRPLVLGSGTMIPGFEAGLVGARAGDTRQLALTFPEDYQSEELRGAATEFEVTVKDVAERRTPELDEAFFERFGITEGGQERFLSEVRQNMERELRQALRNKLKARTLDALLSRTEIDLPRALVAQEIAAMRRQMMQQFGPQASGLDDKALPDELFRDQARRRVALALLSSEVVRRRELQPDAERVRALIEDIASSYEEPEQVVAYYYGNQEQLNQIESSVLEDQVTETILAEAQVTDETLSYEEAMAADKPAAAEGDTESGSKDE